MVIFDVIQADQEYDDDEHCAIRETLKARYGRALAAHQKKGKSKDEKNNQEHVMMKTRGQSLDRRTSSMEGVVSSRGERNIYDDNDLVQEGTIGEERPKEHRGKNMKSSDIKEPFSETSLTTGKATDRRLIHGAEKERVLPAVVKENKKANKGKDGGRASGLKSRKKDELKGESILDDDTLSRDRSMKLSELQCTTDANGDEKGLVKAKTEVTGDSTAAGDGGTKVEKMNKVNNSSWRLEPLSSRPPVRSLAEDGANAVGKAQKIRKKKKAVKGDGHSIENEDVTGPASAEPAKQPDAAPDCKFEDDGRVLVVCVHRADALRTDPAHSSPVVRVHVVDELTGRHVLKEHSPDEPLHTMITRPFDFRQARSLRPEWEEQLVFPERFGRFIEAAHGGPRTLIFFEVMESNRKQNPNEEDEMGKHALAWAFLKLEGANGALNVGYKVRLQMFAPSALRRTSSSTLHVFEWYSRIGRHRYSSTLYVTVMAGQPPQQVQANIGPLSHMLMSQGELEDPETQQVGNSDSSLTNVSGPTQKWSRLPGQACQIPNKLLLSLPAGLAGCFRIAFSHDGRLLAAACAHRDTHPIRLYEIPSGKLLAELHGHLSIVYDLCWSSNDKHLISASADSTAQIWATAPSPREASIILPHPAFVYAARFHPRLDVAIPSLAITGGYDGVLRAWAAEKPTAHLLRELEGHTGYVNTICFDPDGLMMFSGDSVGVILIWSTFVDEAVPGNPTGGWTLHKSVKEDELKGVPINHLNLHPNGRQLLVHAREGALRLFDLRISAIRKFTWLNNFRERLHSTISPCGTFLFAGSESGSVCVWNANTGDKVTMYSGLGFSVPARDVAYHPHDHLVAFCAYGENHRVLLYSYDQSVAQLEASNTIGIKAGVTRDRLSSTMISVQDPVSSLSMAGVSQLSSRAQRVQRALDSVLQEPLDVYGCPIGNNPEHLDIKDSRPLRSSNDKNVPAQSQPVLELSQHAQLLPNTHAHQASALPLSGRSFTTEGRLSSRPSLHFRMLGTEAKITGIEVKSGGDTSHYGTVVALYDYVAGRSDEIALKCGDLLQVLRKDSADRWFGIRTDGTRGYFPAGYVADSAHDVNPSLFESG
uniref:jouberin-like n=1 Tax=Myxine glutinosa TaxID=7769 RepID=UPI00358FBE35